MLTELKIENFKCFDKIELNSKNGLPLNKLTIIAGPNNSGKSSLLQPIIFLKNSIESNKLVYRTDDFDLYNFENVVFNNETDDFITIGITFTPSLDLIKTIDKVYIGFGKTFDLSKIYYEVTITQIGVVYEKIVDGKNEQILFKDNLSNNPTLSIKTSSTNNVISMSHPSFGLMDWQKFVRGSQSELNLILTFYIKIIRDFFSKISYYKPYRQTTYPWTFTASQEPVTIHPFECNDLLQKLLHGLHNKYPEIDRIKKYLKQFDYEINDLKTPLLKTGQFETIITTPVGKTRNLCTLGDGIKTILPMIFKCFFAPKGSVLIIEEPEIHLHKSAQSMLFDILLFAMKNGKQIIFTTHSMDMYLFLRHRIEEGSISMDEVNIYSVTKEEETLNRKVEKKDPSISYLKFKDDCKDLFGIDVRLYEKIFKP